MMSPRAAASTMRAGQGGVAMDAANLPAIGLQTRRRKDGVLGEVYDTDPERQVITVRWPTIPGAYATQECTPEQFQKKWELTGVHLAPPYHSTAAPVIIAVVSLLFLVFIVVRNHRAPYNPYDTEAPVSAETTALLNNAQALDAKYGMAAAQRCAASADDYIRSIARFRFSWDDSGMFQNKFDGFEHSVVSPGVLTLTSRKVKLSNGFGVFNPIEVFCNYDTQSQEVLNYASRPEQE
jgi:hypothetical protein